MKACIGDDEWALLFNETATCFKVYFAIRRNMDFKTGIAGLSDSSRGLTKMSTEFFIDVLRTGGGQGKKDVRPSANDFKNALRRLKTIGLLEDLGNYVFRLPKAIQDNNNQNKLNQSGTEYEISGTLETITNKGLEKSDNAKLKRSGTEVEPPTGYTGNKSTLVDLYIDHSHRDKDFEEFWAAYPRKLNKKKSKDLWNNKKLSAIKNKILDDISERKRLDINWANGTQYVPHPTTYINAERWDDVDKGGNVVILDSVKQGGNNGQHNQLPKSSYKQARSKLEERISNTFEQYFNRY